MTEVPEHLLKRSKDRRTSLDGGTPAADAAPAAESAPVEKATASAAAAPAAVVPAAVPEPVPPYVEAAIKRKKIPIWAIPVLAFLLCGPSCTSVAFLRPPAVNLHSWQPEPRSTPRTARVAMVLPVAAVLVVP